MTTAATIRTADSAHWYTTTGDPCYELPKKDGKGTKVPTLADARKLNLLPSVTTILKVLDKPALNDWKVTQGVLAVLTTPRLPGEADDAFVYRVLQVERVQDQEGATARDFGAEIHAGMEAIMAGQPVNPEILPWIKPAAESIAGYGERVTSEAVLVGVGYAGKTDLIQKAPNSWLIWDFKSTKKLPDRGPWEEHELQLAAYAAAFHRKIAGLTDPALPIKTLNCYISTVEQGKFAIFPNEPDWQKTFNQGFAPLVTHWQWSKGYRAQQ